MYIWQTGNFSRPILAPGFYVWHPWYSLCCWRGSSYSSDGQLVKHFGVYWPILASMGQRSQTFSTDIHVPQKTTDFGDVFFLQVLLQLLNGLCTNWLLFPVIFIVISAHATFWQKFQLPNTCVFMTSCLQCWCHSHQPHLYFVLNTGNSANTRKLGVKCSKHNHLRVTTVFVSTLALGYSSKHSCMNVDSLFSLTNSCFQHRM